MTFFGQVYVIVGKFVQIKNLEYLIFITFWALIIVKTVFWLLEKALEPTLWLHDLCVESAW